MVMMLDHGVVIGEMLADLGRATRVCGEPFVTNHEFTVIERMLRHKTSRQWNVVVTIASAKLSGAVRGSCGEVSAMQRKNGCGEGAASCRNRIAASTKISVEKPGRRWPRAES